MVSSIIISNIVVSWVTSPNIKGLQSITSTGIGYFFVMRDSLWWSTKSLFIKHAKIPVSNKTWILILLESIFTISKIIKQKEALEVRIGSLIKNCATFSSLTVSTAVGHLYFPIQHRPPLIDYLLKHFEPCVVLRLKLLQDNLKLGDFFCHNTNTIFICIIDLSPSTIASWSLKYQFALTQALILWLVLVSIE